MHRPPVYSQLVLTVLPCPPGAWESHRPVFLLKRCQVGFRWMALYSPYLFLAYSRPKPLRTGWRGRWENHGENMELRCVVAMEKGPRPDQEDSLMVGDRVFQNDSVHEAMSISAGHLLVAACDGMGGLAGGELASRFVCEALAAWDDPPSTPRTFRKAIENVQDMARATLSGNCGTTLAGGYMTDSHILVFNVGDSRVYRWRDAQFKRLSHDHSVVQELVDCKMITDEEAFSHPNRNLITAGMGPAFLDVWSSRSIFSRKYRLRSKDRYLICTDGVSDVLRDNQLSNLVGLDADDGSCSDFWEALHEAGLRDNTGFILVHVD